MRILDKIKNKIRFPKEIYSIECFKSNLGYRFYLSHLKVVKSDVQLLETKEFTEVTSLKADFDIKIPIILLVGGRGLLSNTIKSKELEKDEIVRAAFPNVPKEDVISELENLNELGFHVSLLRKDFLKELVQNFEKEGFRAIDLNLGLGTLQSLFKKKYKEQDFEIANYRVEVSTFKVKILDQKNTEEIDVFGYFNTHKLQKSFKIGSNLKFSEIMEKLEEKGFKVSKPHNNRLGIKSNCSYEDIVEILKEN